MSAGAEASGTDCEYVGDDSLFMRLTDTAPPCLSPVKLIEFEFFSQQWRTATNKAATVSMSATTPAAARTQVMA